MMRTPSPSLDVGDNMAVGQTVEARINRMFEAHGIFPLNGIGRNCAVNSPRAQRTPDPAASPSVKCERRWQMTPVSATTTESAVGQFENSRFVIDRSGAIPYESTVVSLRRFNIKAKVSKAVQTSNYSPKETDAARRAAATAAAAAESRALVCLRREIAKGMARPRTAFSTSALVGGAASPLPPTPTESRAVQTSPSCCSSEQTTSRVKFAASCKAALRSANAGPPSVLRNSVAATGDRRPSGGLELNAKRYLLRSSDLLPRLQAESKTALGRHAFSTANLLKPTPQRRAPAPSPLLFRGLHAASREAAEHCCSPEAPLFKRNCETFSRGKEEPPTSKHTKQQQPHRPPFSRRRNQLVQLEFIACVCAHPAGLPTVKAYRELQQADASTEDRKISTAS